LQYWNGSVFEKTSLKSLGLHIQLGYCISIQCNNLIPASDDDFIIIDINGVHAVGLDSCRYEITQPHVTQLLRVCLFPTTTIRPKTTATFWALEYFQI
ncbi:hypothetical protein BD769DRAFT_1356366, partial [Suillus cothurnatus]